MGRICVRITNAGSAAGSVDSVHLLRSGQWPPPPDVPAIKFHLEVAGVKAATTGAGSFPLSGLTTAQLVLLPVRPEDFTDDVHAVVDYGSGHRSAPVRLVPLAGAILGTTSIPGVSLP
jgi:hypothetical protein